MQDPWVDYEGMLVKIREGGEEGVHGHPLGMDRCEVGVFEETDEVG